MSYYRKIRVTQPAAEPVTLAEAKTHLRLDGSAFDAEVTALIPAAREAVENYTNRAWAQAQFKMFFDRTPSDRILDYPMPDVVSLDALSYIDGSEAEQTLTIGDYTLDADRQTIVGDWPAGHDLAVTVTAGPDLSGSPADPVPSCIRSAILLYLTDLFEHRGAQSSLQIYNNPAARAMMQPYRVDIGV